MSKTFQISEVSGERRRLPQTTLSDQLANLRLTRIEAHSEPANAFIRSRPMHGLLMAIHQAYTAHYPLVLSPDHIWICIAQGLARHINEHSETLRSRLL
jgi:hypothetical protein